MKYHIHSTIKEIPAEKWNALTEPNNPFLDHEFLSALEEGQCLNQQTGWMPQYVTIEDDKGELIAACPIFLKSHSYGEFIFDFQWAQAYHQNAISYYPKLVSAIPVTPVSGNRILIKAGLNLESIRDTLDQALLELARKTNSSSIHFLFCQEKEADFLKKSDYLKRTTFEYRWTNQGYETFDDFLSALTHKTRVQIKKERKEAMKPGIEIELLTGNDIKEEHIESCFNFYTIHHHFIYDSPTYLSKKFFFLAKEKLANHMLLVMVKKHGKYVAGAMNFYKGKGLYGRYWGYTEELKHMHFEACYYQLIDFAIRNKIQIFEAGAQGEHKIKRGLIPFYTFSAHKFMHPGFHEAIGKYLETEKEILDRKKAYFSERSPYKTD